MHTDTLQNPTPLLDIDQAAKYLGVAAGTLDLWRSTGRYSLPFIKVGRVVRYTKAGLDQWIASRTLTTTTKAA